MKHDKLYITIGKPFLSSASWVYPLRIMEEPSNCSVFVCAYIYSWQLKWNNGILDRQYGTNGLYYEYDEAPKSLKELFHNHYAPAQIIDIAKYVLSNNPIHLAVEKHFYRRILSLLEEGI